MAEGLEGEEKLNFKRQKAKNVLFTTLILGVPWVAHSFAKGSSASPIFPSLRALPTKTPRTGLAQGCQVVLTAFNPMILQMRYAVGQARKGLSICQKVEPGTGKVWPAGQVQPPSSRPSTPLCCVARRCGWSRLAPGNPEGSQGVTFHPYAPLCTQNLRPGPVAAAQGPCWSPPPHRGLCCGRLRGAERPGPSSQAPRFR